MTTEPEKPMHPVLLDTNVVIAERYWMNTRDFRTLLSEAESVGKVVIVAQIVLDECVNRFTKELRELDEKIMRSEDRLGIKISTGVDRYIKHYQSHLNRIRKRWFEVADYPDDKNIKSIVQRIHDGKKPFKHNEVGFKHYILWRSYSNHLGLYEEEFIYPCHFVTANTVYFFSGKELNSDLKENGRDAIMWQSLRDFVDSEIRPYLASLRNIESLIRSNAYPWVSADLSEIEGSLRDQTTGQYLEVNNMYNASFKPVRCTRLQKFTQFDYRLPSSGSMLMALWTEL